MTTINEARTIFCMKHPDVRPDFVERFSAFTDAYDRAASREEKSFLANNFLKSCTNGEVLLVRNVLTNLLTN